MRLVGAAPRPRVEGRDELTGKVNYFKGAGRAGWSGNVETYSKVFYSEVYPGVDMVYYGKQRELEYDFIMAPDGDPGRIRLAFEGARGLSLDATGDLCWRPPRDRCGSGGRWPIRRLTAGGGRSRPTMC